MAKDATIEKESISKERKKSERKKVTTHSTELKKLKEEQAQLKDQLLRKVAEFDNYKKRTEREFYDRVLNANERLISELLPVIDDMERAIAHAKQTNDVNSLLEGSELIEKKMQGILEKQGLRSLPAVGEEFDPDKHEALLQIEKDGIESGKIVEEHLKGYTLNEKVIRHSQVIVAK